MATQMPSAWTVVYARVGVSVDHPGQLGCSENISSWRRVYCQILPCDSDSHAGSGNQIWNLHTKCSSSPKTSMEDIADTALANICILVSAVTD